MPAKKSTPRVEAHASKESSEILKDHSIWFEKVYWLPALAVNMPDDFHESLIEDEEIPDDVLKAAGFNMKYVKQYRRDQVSSDECSEFLVWNDGDGAALSGFIVCAGAYSTSAFKDVRLREDGSYRMGTFSPGWTTHEWFYATELEDAVAKAVEWRQRSLKKVYEAKQAEEAKK